MTAHGPYSELDYMLDHARRLQRNGQVTMTCSSSDVIKTIEEALAKLNSAYASGVQAERKRIVAWLRIQAMPRSGDDSTRAEWWAEDLRALSDELERAE